SQEAGAPRVRTRPAADGGRRHSRGGQDSARGRRAAILVGGYRRRGRARGGGHARRAGTDCRLPYLCLLALSTPEYSMRPESPRDRRERGPKGRAIDDTALKDVRDLLGARPRRRDLLIEHLHLIQDRFGCLHASHLRALADEMRLSQAEVYEVASFYDHFDVIKEGEPRPAPVTVRVCESISCMIAGADELIEQLQARVDGRQVRVVRAACVGRCAGAPAARVGDREVEHATVEGLLGDVREKRTSVVVPNYVALAQYRAAGGYELYNQVRSGALTADAIIDKLQASGLKGLGGAGFPPGKKWQFVRSYAGPRLMSINGDEGEPGTFK